MTARGRSRPSTLAPLVLATMLLAALLAAPAREPGAGQPVDLGPVLLAPAADRARVSPAVRQVPVRGTSAPGLAVAGARAGTRPSRLAALTAAEPVADLTVVGATWADHGEDHGAAEMLRVEVRAESDGVWGPWEAVEVHDEHAPDPGSAEAGRARPGSDPLVVVGADRVQARVVTGDGNAPADLRLALVDPQPVAADRPAEPVAGDLSTVASATAPRPQIYTRSQWGADESLRSGSPQYGDVRAGFVHHTVSANDYSADQVPAIIRGIYAYHTKGRGWSDIGYNFLVDRFGRIWEGRYGGVDRPVIGAHTLGYNDDAFAMSAIGNFETVRPTDAVLDAYGRLMAWKLGLHGISPTSRQSLDGTTFAAISGHRDAGQTACPGRYLYERLGTIRTKAAAPPTTFPASDVPHNLVGTKVPDLLARERATGALAVLPGDGGPRFGPRRLSRQVMPNADLVVASPDLTGDGRPDLVARDATTRTTRLFPGTADGIFVRARWARQLFAYANTVAAVGDLDRDGHNDLVARDATSGALHLHRGTGTGDFRARRMLLPDVGNLRWIVGVGDATGDQVPDVVGMGPAGALRLFAGTGDGGLRGTSRVIATGWRGRNLVAGGVSLGLDDRVDLVARDRADGRLWLYPLGPAGNVVARTGNLQGFTDLNRLAAVPDLTGDGRADLVGRRADGTIVVLPGNAGRWFGPAQRTGVRRADADRIAVAGDLTGDGRTDVVVRPAGSGWLRLYAGSSTGRLTFTTTRWTGWDVMTAIVGPGDVTGDRIADLAAVDTGRRMWTYPGTGASGLRARLAARTAMVVADQVVAAGRWNADNIPDIVARSASTGDLYLYPGNGSGGLGNPVRIGTGYGGYDVIVGAGDVNRDGKPDLVARARDNKALWLLPGTGGGLGERQYLTGPQRAFDLMG